MLASPRQLLLAAGLACLLGTAVWLWPGKAKGPPHLVVIIVDTLRADRLGCYGFPEQTSPEIDALAAQGVRFAKVYAESSWTRPSVGSMLTSQYPRTLGIYDEQDGILAPRFPTLAELLHARGYRTLGATANPHLNTHFGFHRGFQEYLDSHVILHFFPGGLEQAQTSPAPLHSAQSLFRKLADMLGEPSQPHYLQVNVMEVHDAFHPRLANKRFSDQYLDREDGPYLRAVRQVDEAIGRFVRELAARPGWEHAYYIITSDHGEGLNDHPDVPRSSGHGHFLYPSHTRVPLIVYSPSDDLPKGMVIEQPVSLLSLMPALLELSGTEQPAGLEGVSWLPLVRGGTVTLPNDFVSETQFGNANKIAVFSDKWVYIENRDGYPGIPPRALHATKKAANGHLTNRADRFPQLGEQWRGRLHAWEKTHPRAQPTPAATPIPERDLEQLRALGYIR